MILGATSLALPGHESRGTLDQIQQKIAEVLKAAEAVDRAPITLAEIRSRVAPALAEHSILRSGAADQQHVRPHVHPSLLVKEPLCLRDLAWLFGGDQVLDLLMDRLGEQFARLPEPISCEERARIGREAQSKMVELQRAEELEVLRLAAAGVTAVRRRDADPALLFKVWEELDNESD